jgi:hypothetical protein
MRLTQMHRAMGQVRSGPQLDMAVPRARHDATYGAARHPRTALGLDARRRLAWLVTVDGRQPGFSEGASLDELTDILISLGARDAINLDGGGSTTMVVESANGHLVLNRPIHTGVPGRERPSANHLGVRARPISDGARP